MRRGQAELITMLVHFLKGGLLMQRDYDDCNIYLLLGSLSVLQD